MSLPLMALLSQLLLVQLTCYSYCLNRCLHICIQNRDTLWLLLGFCLCTGSFTGDGSTRRTTEAIYLAIYELAFMKHRFINQLRKHEQARHLLTDLCIALCYSELPVAKYHLVHMGLGFKTGYSNDFCPTERPQGSS